MTFTLSSSDPADAARMGGKAASLARLADERGSVPAWFVVTPEAFEASLISEQRRQLAEAVEPEPVRRLVAKVRASAEVVREIDAALQLLGTDHFLVPIRRGEGLYSPSDRLESQIASVHDRPLTPNPSPLATGARGTREEDRYFAVRSSATDEDGSDHSFAGQLDSFLSVPACDVVRRIAEVWQSGFSERVVAYRLEHGLSPVPSAPAVLVQRMIDAEVSGVAFGADPVGGSRSTIVVSAVFGLGTALVGGDGDADTYRLDLDGNVLDRRIARKTVRHAPDASTSTGVRATEINDDSPALDDATLRRIAALVKRVGDAMGRPQDIEWAVAGGGLYLLQARPITSLATLPDPNGARSIWDNSNIAESYSGVTTPLTFTFARLAYEGVYREFCRIMKVPPAVIAANDAIFSRMLGLIRGRVYYNLLNWYRLLAMLPGFSVNQRFMEQMMGVREGLPPEVALKTQGQTAGERLANRLRLAHSVLGLAWNHLVLRRKIRAFYERLRDALRAPKPSLDRMRLDELTAEFRRLQTGLLTRWDAPLVNDFLAMIFFGVLGQLAKKLAPENPNLQNDLVGGEGGIVSAQPAKLISAMGARASGDPALVAALCDAPIGQALAALRRSTLWADYHSYIDIYGDRCLEELKLESPTLLDDPSSLVRALGHAARRHADRPANPTPLESPRQAAERIVARRLRRMPLRRLLFNWVLRNARHRVRDRENLRFERTRLFGRVRRIFVEVGRRLYAEGLLHSPRDVFYLTLDEILSFVDGTSACNDLRGLARLRQAEFTAHRAAAAPADRFETRGAVYIGNAFQSTAKSSQPFDPAADLRGTGCCPGIVRGPVRVIREPRGAELHHGEIMVAERTDPGWIMLFPAAAGILVERGSLLSHSAIVSRELNIPAIVAIPDLMRRLTSGQWVEMNGAAGVVRLIEAPTA